MKKNNAQEASYEKGYLFGVAALFTSERIDKETLPSGLYVYEVRHKDSDRDTLEECPYELCNWCNTDFFGTFLSARPITMTQDPCRQNAYRYYIPGEDWVSFGKWERSVNEFLSEVSEG